MRKSGQIGGNLSCSSSVREFHLSQLTQAASTKVRSTFDGFHPIFEIGHHRFALFFAGLGAQSSCGTSRRSDERSNAKTTGAGHKGYKESKVLHSDENWQLWLCSSGIEIGWIFGRLRTHLTCRFDRMLSPSQSSWLKISHKTGIVPMPLRHLLYANSRNI